MTVQELTKSLDTIMDALYRMPAQGGGFATACFELGSLRARIQLEGVTGEAAVRIAAEEAQKSSR